MGTQKPKRSSGIDRINWFGAVGQAGQDALAELEDVAANDGFGLVRCARLERGQDRPVTLGDLFQRQIDRTQTTDQRPARGVERLPELQQSAAARRFADQAMELDVSGNKPL